MPHHFLDLAAVILLASLAAVLLSKLKQQPMIGYVIAGVVIGPAGFRIIEDQSQISFVAELGVILLLFVLGMELPLNPFKGTYKTALPVALLLVLLSFASVFTIGLLIDISMAEKIVYAFIISLSSTAVAAKLLEDIDMLTKGTGQVAISVLIAQDLFFHCCWPPCCSRQPSASCC
ncbi:MAG: cation:proton antiporter [Thiogranum sp.]